jgi:formyltetrahydrofolate-dependent phosphoribosylglycinamide formyltransferase
MFERLQNKWKVTGLQLVLILFTFAIGGSLTGYLARLIMPLLDIDQKAFWIAVYILLVTLLWPLTVIMVSIPFGQYRFFAKYLRKIARRMGWRVRSDQDNKTDLVSARSATAVEQKVFRIAIFASGKGSNAKRIVEYFRSSKNIRVDLIVSNKTGAGVLRVAEHNNIRALIIEKERFFRGDAYLPELTGIDLIVLAGFLWKLPSRLIKAFPDRIINIHPALLPRYGGKGMYGEAVHGAVLAANEKESGISIHYVDDEYDHGRIIFQTSCPILENDDVLSLSKRIQKLEHQHYPVIIEKIIGELRLNG